MSARRRGATAVLTAVALGAGLFAAVPANAATAPTVSGPVSAATLDWGVKESFRNYVTGRISKGTISSSNGATQGANNGTFQFSQGSGSLKGGVGQLSFKGTLHFEGHGGLLDLTLANPTVVLTSGTAGVLRVDAKVNAFNGNPAVDVKQVNFSTLTFSGATVASGRLELKSAAAVLTADGAKAFAGFYGAGTQLDPLSFSGSFRDSRVASAPKLSVARSQFGQLSPMTATITGAKAGELVTFKRGTVVLGSARTDAKGVAVLKAKVGPVGSPVITASYPGNADRLPGSVNFTASVIRRVSATNISLGAFAKNTAPVATVTVPKLVDGNFATGKVTLTWSTSGRKATNQTVTITAASKGVIRVKAPFASKTAISVKATYAGDATTAGSTSRVISVTPR